MSKPKSDIELVTYSEGPVQQALQEFTSALRKQGFRLGAAFVMTKDTTGFLFPYDLPQDVKMQMISEMERVLIRMRRHFEQ